MIYNRPTATVLDFFAGSGTTAHAVINLNRTKAYHLKYLLVEIENYFDTVLLPRIKKAIYSKEWREGKPVDREGESHAFKYIRLESYDDSLDNIELNRSSYQQTLIDRNERVKSEYLMNYMLNLEARGSVSLLNPSAFENPFDYSLKITRNGITQIVRADLIETFNYLLGVKVERVQAVDGIVSVEGPIPDGRRVLVLWRDVKKVSSDTLDRWFKDQKHDTKDQTFDFVYVNGDNNLERLRGADQTWQVRLIDEEFHRLMFEADER